MSLGWLQYFDELTMVFAAVGAYMSHKDESVLAEALTKAAMSAADDATGGVASQEVDPIRLSKAVAELVDVFEPVLGLDD